MAADEKKSTHNVVVNALAGGFAGVATDALLFPLDTLKTRLQAARAPAALVPPSPLSAAAASAAASAAAAPAPPAWRLPAGSYRGLASALLGGFPAAAAFWVVYEAGKSALRPLLDERAPRWAFLAHAGAAAAAELAVCAVRNPFELVKQNVQAGRFATSGAALRGLLAAGGGVRALYRGSAPTLLRDVAFNAVQYSLYEDWKARARASKSGSKSESESGRPGAAARAVPPRDLAWFEATVLGALAGGAAAAVTTPLDVVKTRLMTQSQGGPAHGAYAGVADAFRRILREEGWRTLFAGVRPRVASIALGGGIFIGSFEEFRRRLT